LLRNTWNNSGQLALCTGAINLFFLILVKVHTMPKVTIDVADDKVKLLLEVTDLLEIDKSSFEFEDAPGWHKQVLNERLEEYKSGKATLTSWEDFKKELDNEQKQ
jgi:hypothetical protein